jgi:hypothetical protein
MHTSNSPQTSHVIYATRCCTCLKILQILITLPPSLDVCLKLLIPPNNCPVLKILGLRVPSLASKVSPSPLQVRSSPDTGSPQRNHGTVPRHFRRTVLQTRFRWWKEMFRTPKMLLKVIRTRGWVFRCVGLLFNKF